MKWYSTFGPVEVQEQVLRRSRRGQLLRPFCREAQVKPRGYSRRLQRVLSDFGAESSFARSVARIKEHYGIVVPTAAVREQTLRHGRAIAAVPSSNGAKAAPQIITEMDGCLIPVMQPGQGEDGRKNKTLFWREVKLCSARPGGSVENFYGATLGSAETAAWLWQEIAQAAGMKPRSWVHGVGDGAPWIVEKFKDNFGRQGSYLVDFYHVSQYLAQAGAVVVRPGEEKEWLHRQQDRLLHNQVDKVLKSLKPHQESLSAEPAPVRAAHDYLLARRSHLDYMGARAQNLPIGSGEIESGHRHVIQQRLKLTGCWWKEINASAIVNLRVARANNLWTSYWSKTKN